MASTDMIPDPILRQINAHDEGRAAYAAGQPINSLPYSNAQGSSTRVQAIAWLRGYREAQSEAEIAEQEVAGHFRDNVTIHSVDQPDGLTHEVVDVAGNVVRTIAT